MHVRKCPINPCPYVIHYVSLYMDGWVVVGCRFYRLWLCWISKFNEEENSAHTQLTSNTSIHHTQQLCCSSTGTESISPCIPMCFTHRAQIFISTIAIGSTLFILSAVSSQICPAVIPTTCNHLSIKEILHSVFNWNIKNVSLPRAHSGTLEELLCKLLWEKDPLYCVTETLHLSDCVLNWIHAQTPTLSQPNNGLNYGSARGTEFTKAWTLNITWEREKNSQSNYSCNFFVFLGRGKSAQLGKNKRRSQHKYVIMSLSFHRISKLGWSDQKTQQNLHKSCPGLRSEVVQHRHRELN